MFRRSTNGPGPVPFRARTCGRVVWTTALPLLQLPSPMSQRPLLPLLGEPPPERRDAARNREALLIAAQALIDHCGIDAA